MSVQTIDEDSVPNPVISEKRNRAEKDIEEIDEIGEKQDETNNYDGNDHRRDEPVLPISAPVVTELGSSSSKWDWDKVQAFLCEDVDTDAATAPLSAFCFMTGYIDAISFTSTYIWCAFQTGNTVQLSLALGRLFSGPDRGLVFRMPDRLALVSLASFLGGSFLGRIGDRFGAKSRGWLALGTLLQAGLTMAAALCALYAHEGGFATSRGDPSWTDTRGFLALAFASASMGLQALLGTRIGAYFATTVVLTSIWVQVISDPVLFRMKHIYKQRDYKFLAIFSLFCGGFTGRVLTGTIGPAAALGIGAGLRLLITFTWFFVAKVKKKAS